MAKRFVVTFKKQSGNPGSSQFCPVGFEVEVETSGSKPHPTEVRKAVEKKLGISSFSYSCDADLWDCR